MPEEKTDEINAEKEHYNEGFIKPGSYWSFVIKREDVNGGKSTEQIANMCPFIRGVKSYIENILEDMISISIDELAVRNYMKLKESAWKIYEELRKLNKIPAIKSIDVFGDPEGIRVIVDLGQGYMVDFHWTIYNEHWEQVANWYKTSGKKWLREQLGISNSDKWS